MSLMPNIETFIGCIFTVSHAVTQLPYALISAALATAAFLVCGYIG